MKIVTILIAALSAGTLLAQTAPEDLDARIQIFGELTRPQAMTVTQGGTTDQAGTSTGLGLRFMGEVGSSRNWYYEIGGKFNASSKLTLNSAALDTNLTQIKISDSYWTLGAGYLMPLGTAVSLGFHLEGRGESLAARGPQLNYAGVTQFQVNTATTYLRPWGRLSLDGTFSMGRLRPYFGAEVAGTPVKTTQSSDNVGNLQAMDDRTLKSMAPSVAFAFYLGLHF